MPSKKPCASRRGLRGERGYRLLTQHGEKLKHDCVKLVADGRVLAVTDYSPERQPRLLVRKPVGQVELKQLRASWAQGDSALSLSQLVAEVRSYQRAAGVVCSCGGRKASSGSSGNS